MREKLEKLNIVNRNILFDLETTTMKLRKNLIAVAKELDIESAMYERVGEILVTLGLVSADERDGVLDQMPKTGEIFVKSGMINKKILLQVLAYQKGVITKEALDEFIAMNKNLTEDVL